jgi:hypothetical protein
MIGKKPNNMHRFRVQKPTIKTLIILKPYTQPSGCRARFVGAGTIGMPAQNVFLIRKVFNTPENIYVVRQLVIH